MNGFYVFWIVVFVLAIITLLLRSAGIFSLKAQEEARIAADKAKAAETRNEQIITTNFIKGFVDEIEKIVDTTTQPTTTQPTTTQPTTTQPTTQPTTTQPTTTQPTTTQPTTQPTTTQETTTTQPTVITSTVATAPIIPTEAPTSNVAQDVMIMIAGGVVNELGQTAIKQVITKAGRQAAARAVGKIALKSAAVSLRIASKLFAKMGLSSAAKLAAYGIKAGNMAARMAAEKAVKEVTEQAAKQGVKLGAGQAVKRVLAYLAAPPIGQMLLAMDLLSMGLDMGDAGGYGKMGTLQQYRNMKEQAEKDIQENDNANGIVKPVFKGPDIDYTAVTAELSKRMSDPNNAIMNEMNDRMSAKILEDLTNNVITSDDLSNDDIMAKYTSMIDPTAIYQQIIKEMCTSKNGKIVNMVDPLSKYELTEKSNQKNGKIISSFIGKSLPFCEIECQKASGCKAFVHREKRDEDDIDANCWLYSDVTPGVTDATANTYTKIKDIPDNIEVCTFTKDACEKSFSWPLKDDDEYAEFKKVKLNSNVNNKIVESEEEMCVSSDSYMRSVCDSNNIPYDPKTGICKIDATYCKMKGAEWMMNDTTKEYDCAIPINQQFTEAILGTTITRGLKQVFDLSQYESCKPNEIDDGFFCRNTNSCDPTKNQEDCLGLCYPKCDKGYHPVGCNICSPDCPKSSGTTVVTDDGITCRTQKCKDGEEKSGELCYPKCKDGYYGVGPVCWETCPVDYTDIGLICNKDARKDPCPAGMTDDGTSCWLHTYPNGVGTIPLKKPCPANMRDDGTSCWLDTRANGVGTIPLKRPCPANMRDDGISCWLDTYGRGAGYTNWFETWDEQLKRCEKAEGKQCEWVGAIAYPKCKPGYKAVGCCLCEPDGGPGIKVTLGSRQYCAPGETNILGLCYKNCPTGYKFVGGNLCEPQGGPGIKQTLFDRQYCAPGETNVAGLCYKNCKAGYHFVGGNLCEPDGGPGIKKTLFDRTHCDNPKATNVLGKCTIGKSSYGRTAGTIPETTIALKSAAYGRGVGTPAVTIRAKDRIVPYSTKQNAMRMNSTPTEKFESPFDEKFIGIK
jgi:hypothetical protein